MKLLFISDIHGKITNLKYIENLIEKNNFDKVIVLGDLYCDLYYDTEINNSKVKEFLLKYVDICIKGNCDNDSDIEEINQKSINNLECLSIDDINIYITHGDRYNNEKNTKFDKKGVLVFGHRHYPFITKQNDMIYICVGSISLPRQNSDPCYMIYENKRFIIYNIDGDVIDGIDV